MAFPLLPLSLIGSSLLGSLFGGEDPGKVNSFASDGAPTGVMDPRNSLTQALMGTFGVGNALGERLAKPISLRSSVKAPPPISAGGAPFQIGAGAQSFEGEDLPGIDLPVGGLFPQGPKPQRGSLDGMTNEEITRAKRRTPRGV